MSISTNKYKKIIKSTLEDHMFFTDINIEQNGHLKVRGVLKGQPVGPFIFPVSPGNMKAGGKLFVIKSIKKAMIKTGLSHLLPDNKPKKVAPDTEKAPTLARPVSKSQDREMSRQAYIDLGYRRLEQYRLYQQKKKMLAV